MKKNEKHSEGEHDYLNNIQCRDDLAPYMFEENKWIPYILANYPFYSVLFEKFLSNISSMDIMDRNQNHLELVERVMYVFTPQLQRVLYKCTEFIQYDNYFFNNVVDANVLFRCKQHSKDLTHPVGGNNNNNNNNGKINPLFLKYEENGLGEDVAKKLRDISIRAGQSGANYVDSVKNLELNTNHHGITLVD